MFTIVNAIIGILLISYCKADWCISIPGIPFPQAMGVGTYRISDINADSALCPAECFAMNQKYSGVWKLIYCFCFSDLSGTTNTTYSTCASTDGIVIANAVPADINVVYEINVNPNMFPSIITPTSMIPTIYLTDPVGSPMGFKYSYKDRTKIWEYNAAPVDIKRIFNVPGVYVIESQTVKPTNQIKITEAYAEILVYQSLANLNLTCQPLGLTYLLANCTLTIGTGSRISGNILVDGAVIESITIPDIPWERAGSVPNYFSNDFTTGISQAGINIVNSVFQYPGTISFIEINALKAIQIDILLLRPNCAQYYCFSNSACSSDPLCSRQLQCTGMYCPISLSCAANCNNRLLKTENITVLPIDYIIDQQKSITISSTGYQLINLGVQWAVKSGYRMAFHSATEKEVIATTAVRYGEVGTFYSSSHTITVSTNLPASSFSQIKAVHQFSAVSQPQRDIKFKLMFNVTGLKKVSVNLQTLDKTEVQAASSILIGLNINDTSINLTAALTNVPYPFIMNPHTGDMLQYFWTLGDGNTANTTVRMVNYTYNKAGVYNGSIVVYNSLTAKTQNFSIRVLERVIISVFNGTKATSPNMNVNFNLILSNGTDFSCTLSGDKIANVTQPSSNMNFVAQWSTDGFYMVRIDCYNELTRDFKIWNQAIFTNISGLAFEKLGGPSNEISQFRFTWLTGINITFQLMLDNVTRSTTSDQIAKKGSSGDVNITTVGIVVGVLRAFNLISDLILTANLTYAERIVGLQLVPDKIYVANGKPITFSVKMTTGSGVLSVISLTNGISTTFTSSIYFRWVNNYSYPYTFPRPGNYNVSVNCSNIVSSEISAVMVYVIQDLGTYKVNTNSLFFQKGGTLRLSLERTSGVAASMANITIDWKDGTTTFIPVSLFNESAIYDHQFNSNGAYNVSILLMNPLGNATNWILISIINPVINFRCSSVPLNTWNGNPVTIKTLTDGGDNVTLTLNPGNNDIKSQSLSNVTARNTPYDFTYTYNTVTNYSQLVYACNPLGCQNCTNFVQIQYKVIRANFDVKITSGTGGNIEYMKDLLVTTISYSGTAVSFPTALKATFTFSDGSSPVTVDLNSGMMPYSYSKNISVTGYGNVSVRLENLANSENISTTYGVFQKFSNFFVDLTWGATRSLGFGAKKNIYPLNQALYFRPNPSALGTVMEYSFLYTSLKNQTIIFQCNATLINGEFSYTFTVNGDFNVSLIAKNPIDRATADLSITIGGSIRDTKVLTMPVTLLPNYYGFLYITWSIISPESCICVNFDNNTKLIYGAISGCTNCSQYTYTNTKPVNNMLQIPVRFTKEQDYNITVFIYNEYESVFVSQIIPVTFVKCSRPIVSMIQTTYLNSYTPQTEVRSSQIIVSSRIIDLPCSVTKNNIKLWTAQMVDPINFRIIKTISLAGIPTTNNTYLIIPPRFLDYGLYLLTFTVTMDKNLTIYTFQSYNQTYLQIDKSQIIVALSGGGVSMITKGYNEMICFTPKLYSSDPDLFAQNFVNWTWTWTCQQQDETLDPSKMVYPKPLGYTYPNPKTGCFGDGPGTVNFTDSPCFSGTNMDIDRTYVMSLVGKTPDNRDGSSKLTILIVNGIPPNISIECLRPLMCKVNKEGPFAYKERKINPSDALLIGATCIQPLGARCNEGTWFIKYLDIPTNKWVQFTADDATTYIKGITSLQMALLSSFYTKFATIDRIEICYTSLGLTTNGVACIKFYIVPLPSGVICTLDKTVVLQTDRVCSNCTSTEKYQYRIYINSSTEKTTLGLSNDGSFCGEIPYKETVQQYIVRVSNKEGGFTDIFVGNIMVKPLSNAEVNKLITELKDGTDLTLTLSIAKGDFKDMAKNYVKYISVLTLSNENMMKNLFGNLTNNTKDTMGGTGYTSQGFNSLTMTIDKLSPDKKAIYETDRDNKSLIINTMTRGLYVMVPSDIKSLHLISSVVCSIANSFDYVNRQSQWEMSVKLTNLANDLKTMQNSAQRDDITTIATNLLTANFETDAAANIQIDKGIIQDIQYSKENFLDYDTNLESTYKNYMDSTDGDAAADSLTIETNSNFQSKIALGVGKNSKQTIATVTKVLRDSKVIDDVPNDILTSHLHYYSSKTKLSEISNRNYTKGRSTINLPDICAAMNISNQNCSDPNNPIGLEIIATPNNVRAYMPSPNGEGLPIPMIGDVIAVNLYLDSQAAEKRAEPSGPGNYTIFIGRDPTFAVPDFNFSEPEPRIADPKVIPGTGTIFTGPLKYEQKLVMYQFNLKGKDQSVHFQLSNNISKKCTQYLVVGRLGSPPSLTRSPDGTTDPINFSFWGMIPTDTKYCYINASSNDPDPFTFFVNNELFNKSKAAVILSQPDYSKTLNTLYFGVRELTPKEWNTYTQSNKPPFPYNISAQINTTFRVRIYSSGCYFYSNDYQNSWGTAGCLVGPLTTPQKTHCICNHLTTFAGGWVVAPNTIDFNYVFSNFDFTKNLTLFVTEIVIVLVFILIFIWARRQDIKDIEKIGVTPLASNDPNDMYLYEIVVDTSIRGNAGTCSNVYFILSGEMDETDPRHLADAKRPILKRGNVDRFLLAVPRPLGALQYVRLWHDNSGKGKDASWYCNYFGVTDLQTKEKFHFLANNWFAVEENDGQIDRIIAVASVQELLKFNEVFTRKMKLNLSEDHLWLSVMARPPESRFTRVERVACCLLLLFLTMLTTCMFYQTEGPSKTKDNVLQIGPFALTPREIWTGLISNIIAFVPLFLIIELFRKSQLKHGHANKLRQVVESHLRISIGSQENKGYQSSTATLMRNEEMEISRPNTPIPKNNGMPFSEIPDYEKENPQDESDEQNPKKVIRKRLLPWWTRVFVWIFLIVLLIVSIFFTTLYGIQFGDIACKKWISSMFISFFTSILLTQPIKVILLAMFFAMVFKKSSMINNIEFIDEEEELMNELGKRNGLLRNEEYLHNELYNAPIRPHRYVVQPPPKEELEKARDMRLKELKMYDVMREIAFYLIFFCTLVFITYSLRDPNAYLLKNELTKLFITPTNQDWQFTGITREEQFWTWALNVLVPGLRAPIWYNNKPQMYQRGFIANRNNRLMGYAIIRQVRTKKDSCKVYDYVKPLVKHCYSEYNIFNQDTGSYGPGWKKVRNNVTATPEFSFVTEKSMDGIPYLGRIGVYSGGGYVYQFRSNISNLYRDISLLRDNHWIDFQTRAIFIEFTTYNPNINLFAINTYALELPGSGGIWTVYRVEPANLLGLYSGGVKALEIFAQILYAIFIIVMIVKEIRNIMKQKWKYFSQFWNLCEVFIIGGSFAAVAGFVYVTVATNKLTTKFSQYGGNIYLNFNYVAFWNENLGYLISLIVFVSTLKFIRLLRFNKRIGMLGSVISYCGKDLRQFFIIFAITFLAFVMVFYSLFMDSLYRYHTFLFATEASMQIALGKFAFLELYQKEPIFGPIVFACYVLFIIFVLLNMFIAILNEGFSVVKADIELQGNDYEMVQFFMTKFIMWTGINNTKIGKRLIKTGITDQIYKDIDTRQLSSKVDEFPEKIEQLLNYFNRIIYDGKKGYNQNDKQFSSVLFERPKPTVKSGDEGSEISRPVSATSNVLRSRNPPQMTPIGK